MVIQSVTKNEKFKSCQWFELKAWHMTVLIWTEPKVFTVYPHSLQEGLQANVSLQTYWIAVWHE